MNILLGYGNKLCRDFITNHLSHSAPGFEFIVTDTLRDSLRIVAEQDDLDVIAVDTEMRDMNGLTGIRQMVSQCSGRAPVAVIGPNCSAQHIRDLLITGASGYLTYSLSADALMAAFTLLKAGEQYVPAELFEQEDHSGVVPDGWLTGRERDVLNGLLTGKSNKEIAMSYGLSEVTIKHHLKNLRSKLGARNRTHAVCRAIELGLADDTSLSA